MEDTETNETEEVEEDFGEESEENNEDTGSFESIEDIVESSNYPRFRNKKVNPFLEITDNTQQVQELETGIQNTPSTNTIDNTPQYTASTYTPKGGDYEGGRDHDENNDRDVYPKQIQARPILNPFLPDTFSGANTFSGFNQPRFRPSNEFASSEYPGSGEAKKYDSGPAQESKKIKDAKRRI